MINNQILREFREKVVANKAQDQSLNIFDRLQPLDCEDSDTSIFPPIFISKKYLRIITSQNIKEFNELINGRGYRKLNQLLAPQVDTVQQDPLMISFQSSRSGSQHELMTQLLNSISQKTDLEFRHPFI